MKPQVEKFMFQKRDIRDNFRISMHRNIQLYVCTYVYIYTARYIQIRHIAIELS